MTDANAAKDLKEPKDREEERQPRDASPEEDDESFDDTSHLEEVPDGSGCTEIWEHLSERREKEREES